MLRRKKLPQRIEDKMKQWRSGLMGSMPIGYINFHQNLANETLEAMQKSGVKVHNRYMAADGWADGMQVIHAIVELPNEKLLKIKYSDSGQGFMEKTDTGLWVRPYDAIMQEFWARD